MSAAADRAPIRIRKNATEQLQVELSEYHGRQLVSLRVWWTPDNGATWRPSKSGFALRVEALPDLVSGLTVLEADARRRGLLEAAGAHPRLRQARDRREARAAVAPDPGHANSAPRDAPRTSADLAGQ